MCNTSIFAGRVLNLLASRPAGPGPAAESTVEITVVPIEITVKFCRSSQFMDVLSYMYRGLERMVFGPRGQGKDNVVTCRWRL